MYNRKSVFAIYMITSNSEYLLSTGDAANEIDIQTRIDCITSFYHTVNVTHHDALHPAISLPPFLYCCTTNLPRIR